MQLLNWKYIFTLSVLLLFLNVACSSTKPAPPEINLLDAIAQGEIQSVQQHMDAGTNPNKHFIPFPFPFAGASALHLAVVIDNPEIVTLLIDGGADINLNAKDLSEASPLIWAAYWGKPNSAKILIAQGANIKKTDNSGNNVYDVLKIKNIFVPEQEVAALNKARQIIAQLLP